MKKNTIAENSKDNLLDLDRRNKMKLIINSLCIYISLSFSLFLSSPLFFSLFLSFSLFSLLSSLFLSFPLFSSLFLSFPVFSSLSPFFSWFALLPGLFFFLVSTELVPWRVLVRQTSRSWFFFCFSLSF